MTVFVVICRGGHGETTTVFTTSELAQQSIQRDREYLVGMGYLGNLTVEVAEVHVHDRLFRVHPASRAGVKS